MELKILKQQELLGRNITVYGTNENPLFLAKDVAEWIEHSNVSMMLNSIDEDEKQLIQIGTLNNAYSAWTLTENGMYEVLFQSRKPIAKEIKKGVKAILREVRLNGGYIASHENDTPEMIMARALQVASQTIENFKNKTKRLEMQNQIQKDEIEKARPLVELANECYVSTGSMTASIVSARLGFKSANELNKHLKNIGVQYKIKGDDCWKLTSKYSNKGYTKTIPFPYPKPDGTIGTRNSMEWTESGFVFLREILTVKMLHNV